MAPAGRQKVEQAVTQYQTHNTWNMTEASWCIYTLICQLTGPVTNHCPANGLGHLRMVEHSNVHIISLQLVIHGYACEHWLIATETYDRIPASVIARTFVGRGGTPFGRSTIDIVYKLRMHIITTFPLPSP